MWPFYLVSAVFGYLLGSFPTGYLVGRFHGIDIREHGSKNMGATNVVRVLGKRPGYFVFICDVMKGLLTVRLAIWYVYHAERAASESLHLDSAFINDVLRRSMTPPDAALATNAHFTAQAMAQNTALATSFAASVGIIAGLACILGHNFPVWLRFRGGKGVATTVGVLLGLMPAAVGVTAVVWVATFYLSRYVSLASLLGAAILPVSVWFLTRYQGRIAGPPWLFYFSLLAAALIFWRHRTNIQRLLNGTEAKFARKP